MSELATLAIGQHECECVRAEFWSIMMNLFGGFLSRRLCSLDGARLPAFESRSNPNILALPFGGGVSSSPVLKFDRIAIRLEYYTNGYSSLVLRHCLRPHRITSGTNGADTTLLTN